jgi:uncharacterized phage protein (TIGR02218 family)
VEGGEGEIQECKIMRSATAELFDYLNDLRSGDAKAVVADLYTFTLNSGSVLTYTNADITIVWNGFTYLANSVLVDGLRFKCTSGLDVDQQQITIAARRTDTVGGVPFLEALRKGVFDRCEIQRERAFLKSWDDAPVGALIMFKGRIGSIDKIGRTVAEVSVNSDLVLLDLDMPRNVYSPHCQHVLYDSGCGILKTSFGVSGTIESGSTRTVVNWSSSSVDYKQGTIAFTSGASNGITATIKDATASSLVLAYPLVDVPAEGESFVAYWGCDHTVSTCKAKFDNLTSFRGFPYIPYPIYGL